MRTLIIGDPHIKADELDDAEALHRVIVDTVCTYKPDAIWLLGDLYHTHAIVNVSVQQFWMRVFDELGPRALALVGNHDRPGDRNSSAHALQVHKEQIMVVDKPTVIDKTLFLPYYHDRDEFVRVANEHPDCDTLVCHQTFDGAQYEGGFFAKDGVDASLVPQEKVISGHIHTPSNIGKVWYPGAPRYQTIADANISRAIHVVQDGELLATVGTTPHVRAIWQLTDTPDGGGSTVEDLMSTSNIKDKDKVVVNLQGPKAWCEKRKAELYAVRPSIRFRAFITDGRQAKVRESDGIAVAFQKHMTAFRPKNGTPKDVLEKMVQERVHV